MVKLYKAITVLRGYSSVLRSLIKQIIKVSGDLARLEVRIFELSLGFGLFGICSPDLSALK